MNPQMQEILEKYATLNPLPPESLTPEAARHLPELKDVLALVQQEHMGQRLWGKFVEPIGAMEHILIPTRDGRQILARIYYPLLEGLNPALLYFHGGGFVLGDLNSCDAACRSLANGAECVVVSLAYRQAPENKYPTARNDAFDAYTWLLTHASTIGVDSSLVAVAGEGAGGNLAAVLCLQAKKYSLPQPLQQLLIYPILDARFETPSYLENASAKPLNRELMKWYWTHYLKDASERLDPYASPLRHNDLRELAPATMITAEVDPLRSEGEAYADALLSFGVAVETKRFHGMPHDFFGLGALVSEARLATKFATERLRKAFVLQFGKKKSA